MNALELRLLFALGFRLNISPDTFARYCVALECRIVMADPVPLPSPVSDDDEAVTKAEKVETYGRTHVDTILSFVLSLCTCVRAC